MVNYLQVNCGSMMSHPMIHYLITLAVKLSMGVYMPKYGGIYAYLPLILTWPSDGPQPCSAEKLLQYIDRDVMCGIRNLTI